MKEKIGNVILNYDFYSGEDLYSDGEVENLLLEIAKNKPESEFDKIIFESKSWPVLYHLSNLRANIIDWLPIDKQDNVLEIGAGCGAITWNLARKANYVSCVELSKKRSLINAYRNREFGNIEILVGNFESIEKNIEAFDYITLIGVFEYCKSFIAKMNPYENFLLMLKKHLKKNAKIVIAIENKFGMKYWAGCKEDHTDKYFEGLEGYTTTDSVRTFSKSELENLFKSVGFDKYKFYYPYPDYKFPTVIYSDKYLPKSGQLNNNLINLDNDRLVLFDESKVFDCVIKENVFPLFANSYLVVIDT